MRTSLRGRRVIGVAAAAVVVSTAALTTGVGTAFADNDYLQIGVPEYNLTLPAAVDGASVTKTVHIHVLHQTEGPGPAATLTIDAGGLAGVVQVAAWPKSCTVSGAIATCAVDHVDGPSGVPSYLDLDVTADPKASAGDHGDLKLSATADGLGSAEETETLTVGSGPDLVLQPLKSLSGVAVGSTVTAPVQWSNLGNAPAARTVVELTTMVGLELADHFSNCRYSPPRDGARKDVTAVCVIDRSVAPGATWRLSTDIKATVTTGAWYTFLSATVLPPGSDADQAVAAAQDYTPGTGPKLTAESATPSNAPLARDLNPNDNYSELVVRADNHAHYSAVGAVVQVDKGASVPVTVGMRNSGPATIFDRSGGEGADHLRVTFPAGATATKVPDGCSLVKDGAKGHGPYLCNSGDAYVQPGGYQATWTFTVRADQTLTDVRGTAQLSSMLSEINGTPVTFPWDTSTDGYAADIVFNGTTATSSPSPSPSSSASSPAAGSPATSPAHPSGAPTASPSTTEAPGSLASTGGGGTTTLLADLGAAGIAFGAGVFVLSRRRRAFDRA